MQTAEIHSRFLKHFEQRDHTIVPSASLVSDDPAIMFTIAGMVPFIPYLSGRVPAPWLRVADVQKCIRTTDIASIRRELVPSGVDDATDERSTHRIEATQRRSLEVAGAVW